MLVPLLIFIAVGLITYAGFVKLAARILHYAVSWKSGLLFAAIVLVVVVFARILDLGQPAAISIGHGVIVLLGAIIFGSWFFSGRGTDRSGTVLGWSGGARLTGLAFGIMVLIALTIVVPLQLFLTKHLPHAP
jgi:hypothetical protein